MKLRKIALAAAIACISYAGNAIAIENGPVRLVSGCAAPACGCGQPVCGCETAIAPLGGGCATGCRSNSCDTGGCLSDCDLGDPWSLFGEHCGWTAGGWLQTGYHSKANGLFNSRADELQIHQAWMYLEKTADGSNGLGWGGRFDAMYGTDSQDTQAFGANRGWDNGFDNGPDYGFAMPQAYVEAAYGDMSVKVGHFFTLIGYEVVPATGNFFYSHAYTMYNSEPFTHTGVLGTFNLSDDLTAWGGYTLGWDSGFNDNGDSFLGGFSAAMSDNLTLTYATSLGRFGERRFGAQAERGYMHSIVADVALRDDLQYIFQSDYLDSEDAAGATVRDTFGINQYLIKTINDCWAVGGRFEWWNNDSLGADSDVYALTLGVNHKPHANLLVRPEIRWDWDDDQITGLEDGEDQFTLGMDTIFLF